MNARLVALCVLIGAGASLAVGLWMAQTQSPLDSSLAPAYRILGEPVKALDHLIARALPIDDVDEEQLGVVLQSRYATTATRSDPDVVYVNDLVDQLETYAKKPFDYKAYVI
ncbi:MAG: hypothetical protein IH885_08590, partial [Myxococcales bacterium]|nr:hypothetical protein [Myxococcales bacterium]